MFPSRISSVVISIPRQRNMSSAYQVHFPYAGDLESQELSGNSVVGRKRAWFVWTAIKWTLAIVSGLIEAMLLNLIRRGMSEWAWCRRVRFIFVYAYSIAKIPTVGHPSSGTVTPWPYVNQASHSHQCPSVSFLCQTESEVVRRALNSVACGWSTTTSSRCQFQLFLCINVVGYGAVVICHPIFSLYIFAVEGSNVHETEDGLSQFYSNGRHRLCMGHSQQGFIWLSSQSVLSTRIWLAVLLPKSFSVLLSFVSSWSSCSNGSFRGNWRLFIRENTFTFIFSETFFKGSDGRRKTAYVMLYFSSNADWKYSTMYVSSHLQTSPTISFREAQYPYLVVLLLIAPAPSLSLTSFLSLLQNISSSVPLSLIQYVCSLPIPDRWGSLHCFWLPDDDLIIADG